LLSCVNVLVGMRLVEFRERERSDPGLAFRCRELKSMQLFLASTLNYAKVLERYDCSSIAIETEGWYHEDFLVDKEWKRKWDLIVVLIKSMSLCDGSEELGS
jgi:hypothetical protein